MIDRFYLKPVDLERFRCGPLGPHLESFASRLSEQGYSTQVGMQKIRLVAFLSRWLEQMQIGIQQLDEQRIADFLRARRKPLRRHRQVRHTLTQWVQPLRRSKILGEPRPPQAENPTDQWLQDYERFLIQERGLSQATLDNYLPMARRFLSHAFGTQAVQLDERAADDVNGFILRDKSTFSPKRVQLTTSALRSFLGFLYLRGQLTRPLAASVPTVATWRWSELPQFLEPQQVQRLLHSCNRSAPCGRRDYAALLLLARLGLRAGELTHLLRHSLATQRLRGGASLTQIGQILRHQLPQTTEIYAKVDFAALRAVAQPWPGGVQ